jgi:hypothetical protein
MFPRDTLDGALVMAPMTKGSDVPCNIPDAEIVGVNIRTGIPLVYELTDDLAPIESCYLGDPEAVKKAAVAVAGQLTR